MILNENLVTLTPVGTPGGLVKGFQEHQKTKCQTEPEAGTGSLPHPFWLTLNYICDILIEDQSNHFVVTCLISL